ncbi:peptide chain release factor N(5)-glutamine methyltransferase [Secundilactobacillus folii]|uniref:Release factor glutamine methyltransferase n=1 Tax=Secundilactobacillus folii TaxID=2678357 RepID=A0A7X2XVW4_9LACO|nr:peptide chain release factor N(5)-glutamine methyltransferase [Secundilactobacillus folii]MTV82505.1 peptide chain release factor N(5)-glutamine methyltransferase [Secundilactobacillus folii]
MAKRTYYEALKWASLFIQDNHLDQSAAKYLLQELAHLDQTHLLLKYREPMSDLLWDWFQVAIQQYVNGRPPQYIIGEAPFYGEQFTVNENVLIPRQETEELVEWVLQENDEQLRTVLDIGTGSGAIGLTLKKQRPKWRLTLTDLSVSAIGVARANAQQLGVKAELLEGNLLLPVAGRHFDVMVSNPPYISRDEVGEMDADVVQSEPEMALFADQHGLAIYQQLADQLQQRVATADALYLEIGFQQRLSVTQIFQQHFPSAAITTRQDIAGHDRMVQIVF